MPTDGDRDGDRVERGERRAGHGEGGLGRGGSGSARSGRPARSSRPAAARSSGARLAARPSRAAASDRPARSTRPVAQRRPDSGTAPAAAVRRPGPSPKPQAPRRFPNPRLTGLGGGLFCGAVMMLLGYLDALLFGASLTVYSVLFLPVCVLTAVWVRGGDLVTAPVVLPIAFAVGLVPVADNGGGISGHLMGIFTALATQAGWLYGGTLIAGLVVTVRKVRLIARRAAARRRSSP
ncbi:DUF6542 domain-containing protein [Streptomyces cyaneochromogenes]|uniref:DUF6542 domain-containing protein n=1 Tax=Streptomyces cyaneochromogenes TaxID=2496836 RepID=UPI002687AE54